MTTTTAPGTDTAVSREISEAIGRNAFHGGGDRTKISGMMGPDADNFMPRVAIQAFDAERRQYGLRDSERALQPCNGFIDQCLPEAGPLAPISRGSYGHE